jgi:UbiD family decarboxylase
VEEAPCQEIVITEGIDVMATLPIPKYTLRDGGRILGSSIMLISGEYYRGGFHVNFSRMSFRGKDWSSIPTWTGTHIGEISLVDHAGKKIPVTANICPPPAVIMAAGTFFLHDIVPRGSDKLGFAGALQGSPVRVVKAKTVDAYAMADAEWVMEGYIDTEERVWETEEAEKVGKGIAPLFPEWPGFLGRAYRPRKFQVTAITHRKDPIFFIPLARSWDADVFSSPFREACFYEMADRVFPGLVVDVNILPGVAGWGGNVVFQVNKGARRFEGKQRTILQAALNLSQGLRLAIAVDEDVNIYSPTDLLWAITTRVDPRKDIISSAGGGVGQLLSPTEREGGGEKPTYQYTFEGGVGIDATVPFDSKWSFERAHHASDQIDLRRWFSEEEIARVRAMQSDYARYMAETGR